MSGYHGRHWWRARADLDDVSGEAILRWQYVTDPLYSGRGVYVDDVVVRTRALPTFHGEKHPDAFAADGWSLVAR